MRGSSNHPPGCAYRTYALAEQADNNQAAASALPIEVRSLLAEDLVNFESDIPASYRVLSDRKRLQTEWRVRYADRTTLYLGEDWVRNIGHIGALQYLVKLKRSKLLPFDKIKIVARISEIANLVLLNLYSDDIQIITDPNQVIALAPLVCGAGLRFYDLLSWEGQDEIPTAVAYNRIETAWSHRREASILTLPRDLDEFGRSELQRAGIAPDAKFICLHVREDGFHGDTANALRSSSVEAFEGVADLARRRGDQVIRLGDASMRPVSDLANVFDYALSALKSPELDVYLVARCRFYVGTTSGLMYAPHCFGIRTLITNYIHVFGAPPFGDLSLYTPKLIVQNGKVISLKAMRETAWMEAMYHDRNLLQRNAMAMDNDAADLTAATDDMYTASSRRWPMTALIRQSSGDARVAPSFVKRHPDLQRRSFLNKIWQKRRV